jgi:hypothetical protein
VPSKPKTPLLACILPGGEQTGHYPGSHCSSLGPIGQESSQEIYEIYEMYETDEEEFCGERRTSGHNQEAYETDEEEFLRTGDTDTSPAVLTSFAALNLTQGPVKMKNTAKRDLSTARRMKVQTHAQGYFLAYFNLWWKRMEVEGR